MTNIKEVSEHSISVHSKAGSSAKLGSNKSKDISLGSIKYEDQQNHVEGEGKVSSESISEHKSFESDDNFGQKAAQ
jgi:hypothetical protein